MGQTAALGWRGWIKPVLRGGNGVCTLIGPGLGELLREGNTQALSWRRRGEEIGWSWHIGCLGWAREWGWGEMTDVERSGDRCLRWVDE